MLAKASYALDDLDEADRWCATSEDAAAADDLAAQIEWRAVRAKVMARRGAPEDAVALAREAVGIAERTDFVTIHGDACVDLAETLELAGRSDEAQEALRRALDLYERKGNLVSAERARSRLR